MNWDHLTAVFGGTFDPPHLGHRIAVNGLFMHPKVARVVIVPSATPPHKPAQAPCEHRMEMTRLNFAPPFAGPVEINPLEMEQALRTPDQPNFSYHTIQALTAQYGDLAFVIGADQLEALPSWHRFPEVFRLCHWIVLTRKPCGENLVRRNLQKLEGSGLIRPSRAHDAQWEICGKPFFLKTVPTEAPELSSRFIRETIARTGHPPEGTLLNTVADYLMQNRLYGSKQL